MSWQDAQADDDAHRLRSKSSSTSTANAVVYAAVRQVRPSELSTVAAKPLFFQAVMPGENNFRSHEECMWLAKGVPKPPPSSGYTFSRRQIDEQMNFFKLKKEAHIKSSNLIDCHKYTIIAVCKCVKFVNETVVLFSLVRQHIMPLCSIFASSAR
jgi:hypothetical protein